MIIHVVHSNSQYQSWPRVLSFSINNIVLKLLNFMKVYLKGICILENCSLHHLFSKNIVNDNMFLTSYVLNSSTVKSIIESIPFAKHLLCNTARSESTPSRYAPRDYLYINCNTSRYHPVENHES